MSAPAPGSRTQYKHLFGLGDAEELEATAYGVSVMTRPEIAACVAACKGAVRRITALKPRIDALVANSMMLVVTDTTTPLLVQTALKEHNDLSLVLLDPELDEESPEFTGSLLDLTKACATQAVVLVLARETLIRVRSEVTALLANRAESILRDWRPIARPATNEMHNRVGTLEQRVRDLSVPKQLVLLAESKSARVQSMQSPSVFDSTPHLKVARAATYTGTIKDKAHLDVVNRKPHESKMLVVDTVDKSKNADVILQWIATHELYLQTFVPADQPGQGITMIAWCLMHLGPAATLFWSRQHFETWHPLRHDAALFFKYILAALTPNDSDETSYREFFKHVYATFINFEAWTVALEVLILQNAGAEDRYKLSPVRIWEHIDTGSPKHIREAFIREKCRADTSLLVLQQVAKQAEDIEKEASRNEGSSNYYNNNIRDSRSRPPVPRTPFRSFRRAGSSLHAMSGEDSQIFLLDNNDEGDQELGDDEQAFNDSLLYAIGRNNSLKPQAAFANTGRDTRLCYQCGKPGHLSLECPDRKVQPPPSATVAAATPARKVWQSRQVARETGFHNPQYRPQGQISKQFSSPRPMGEPRAWFRNNQGKLTAITEEDEDRIVDGAEIVDRVLLMKDETGSLFVMA